MTMQTIIATIREKLLDTLAELYPDQKIDEAIAEITPATKTEFGDYQCNAAMRLTKIIGQKPRDIADAIASALRQNNMFENIEIAGPGFINFFLAPQYVEQQLQQLSHDPRLGVAKNVPPQRVVIDFSSPNIAKEMHVGHLRSTIIGDAIARLMEFMGNDVLRLNHVGDWGTAFGMLIAYLKTHVPNFLDQAPTADIRTLLNWYRAAKEKFDQDDAFKTQAKAEVVALQGGDQSALRVWEMICNISRRSFQDVYKILDIKITERGESFYNPWLAEVVEALEQQQLISISDGAKVVLLEGFKNRQGEELPLIVQKSDGGYNYATTDMAALQHRVHSEGADRIIYVTDAGQAMHFAMIFQAAAKAHFYDPSKVRLDHVGFGLVLGSDGKKFKTRSGEFEPLTTLLDKAVAKAQEILTARNPDWSEAVIKHTAEVLGIAAVKYADLSSNRTSDYRFDYDRMLQFEGNTAAFLLYAYVRTQSIQRKVNVEKDLVQNATIKLVHDSERQLALHLLRFNEIIYRFADDLYPNRLTDYLYQLAEKFNAFFRDCRVQDDPLQNSRLLLCDMVARTMQVGLSLLGIQTIDRM